MLGVVYNGSNAYSLFLCSLLGIKKNGFDRENAWEFVEPPQSLYGLGKDQKPPAPIYLNVPFLARRSGCCK
jgi:hypothetical protein